MTDNPIVLITGCSTGIGRSTAVRLAESGRWNVFATARNPESIKDLADAGIQTRRLDLTDEESMCAVMKEVEDNLYGLINNAGYGEYGVLEELPVEALRQGFETNVIGAVRLCQLALPGMRKRENGRIVFIGSMGGRFTMPAAAGYHMTKYAMESLVDALRFEVSPFGVHVTLLQPGMVRTAFGETATTTLARNSRPDSPYAELIKQTSTLMAGAFSDANFGVPPEEVAEAVRRALTDTEPATREVVTDDATLIDLRTQLSDLEFDAVLRQMQAHTLSPEVPSS